MKGPTAQEWEFWLGLATDYELPQPFSTIKTLDRYRDEAIQTLLFPCHKPRLRQA
jgi:hypothetical protein